MTESYSPYLELGGCDAFSEGSTLCHHGGMK